MNGEWNGWGMGNVGFLGGVKGLSVLGLVWVRIGEKFFDFLFWGFVRGLSLVDIVGFVGLLFLGLWG